uniref:hypothetical protein n=1 Tax=Clostridium sp. NkU-1 TaxID=1095009 RepID=UPI0032614155
MQINLKKFCHDADIKCEELSVQKYFKPGMCDGAFLTKEYTYDAQILKEWLMTEIAKYPNIELRYNVRIQNIKRTENYYEMHLKSGEVISSDFVLNATYASVNQILRQLDFELFKIKYELCEIILCEVDDKLNDIGFTVMDGPFFLNYALW